MSKTTDPWSQVEAHDISSLECRSPGELRATLSALSTLSAVAVLSWLAVSVAGAQHHGAHSAGKIETFLVEGLRIDPDAPPRGSAVGRAGARLADGGYLHLVYGKPYARGRQIFGGLVAFDQVWATGAHQSSELATTVPITVGDQRVEPGVYSLFTTPGKTSWRLHLNSALGMHLADDYDPDLDVAVVDAAPKTLDSPSPGLVLEFIDADGTLALRIRWDRTVVDFPITVHAD